MKTKLLISLNRLLRILRVAHGANRWLLKYFLFILEIILWVAVLYIITPILASLTIPIWGKQVQLSTSDFILLITAAFVLAYTYEAKKLREESVFQRKMSAACDIRFKMQDSYIIMGVDEGDHPFVKITAPEELNSVSSVTFLSAILGQPIGKCGKFFKQEREDEYLSANYRIITQEGRNSFVKTLELQDGQIQARVLTTNGLEFIYTFRSVEENWKRVHKSEDKYIVDEFTLVKKELHEG